MELEAEKLRLIESKMNYAVQQEEYNLFEMLKPKMWERRGLWYVEHGSIAGCGLTPYKAILDFNYAWHKKNGKGDYFDKHHTKI